MATINGVAAIWNQHHDGRGLRTVTKAQLLQLLDGFDDTQLVAFSYRGSDYWRTEAVDGITVAEEYVLEASAYSPTGWAVPDEESDDGDGEDEEVPDEDDDPDGRPTVVVLS